MTYPNSQTISSSISPSLRATLTLSEAKGKGKQSPLIDRESAYENLQNVILKLAVKKDNVRSAPTARTEFTQLVEQALEAYRQYMQTIATGEL